LNNDGVINGNLSVGGLLKGGGTLNGNLSLSGTLASGDSPAITTVKGDLTLDSSARLTMEVSGTQAGTSFSQIKVSGNVTLAGALELSTLSGLTMGSPITLVDNTGTTTTTSGYFTTIITSGSTYAISGSTSSYTITVNGTDYLLNYAANADDDGVYNDVTLSVIPEPGVWAMLLGGLGSLVSIQRLRRRG
jgi:fibronectin-binding autotransporter adhesin